MKRKLAFLAALLTSTLILALMMGSSGADIKSLSWLGTTYTGTDAFYGAPYTIYAYEAGSNATLVISVENLEGKQINVSAVGVRFDWGGSYNSTDVSINSPIVMDRDGLMTFAVSFTAPSTSVASNRFLHGYKIYVEHVNSTTGPKEIVGTMTKSYTADPDFAVYSANQADARELSQVISGIESSVPIEPLTFNSTAARLFVYTAKNETSIGNENYRRGNFADAKTHYATALSLYNNAYSMEETRGVELEDLNVNLVQAQINNIQAWASMVSSLSTTSMLLGLAIVLFGIGYVIKQLGTLKKPVAESLKE